MDKNLITRKNLEDNNYKHIQTLSNLELHAKEEHRLIVEQQKDFKDLYAIHSNYLTHDMMNIKYKRLCEGLQLDLFYNIKPFDNTKNLEEYITLLHTRV